MNFEFNEEQKLLRNAVNDQTKREFEPFLAQYPEDQPLPKEACHQLSQMVKPLGVLGARIPVEYGGAGMDYVSQGIINEALPGDVLWCSGADVAALRIFLAGTAEQKQRFLPGLLSGTTQSGGAVSEPNVGSDPRGIETKAVLDGDYYIVNGNKIWSSHCDIADLILVIVSLGRDEKGRNLITPLILEREVSPWESRTIPTIGLKRHHLCELSLRDVRVPRENLLGGAGEAHRTLTFSWLGMRPLMGLRSVALAQKALDASIAYARQRSQFGRVIGSFQLIQRMIVEMAVFVETSRYLCYKALTALDKREWCTKESSMAKAYATESAVKVTLMAIQVHGAYGVAVENKLEKLHRDAVMMIPPDGTIEIHTLSVGKELLGIRAFV